MQQSIDLANKEEYCNIAVTHPGAYYYLNKNDIESLYGG